MHVAKVNGSYILLTMDGRTLATSDFSNFAHKLKEVLDRGEIKTPAMGIRQESGGETSDEKGSSRKP